MLNKIISVGFNLLTVFLLLLAAHTMGFGQSEYIRDYEKVIAEYQQSPFDSHPANEGEYQTIRINEDSKYAGFKNEMRKVNSRRNENLLDAKQLCQKELTRINRNKCLESIDAGIQTDAANYIEALRKMGRIYESRINKLTEQRKKFTPAQMTRPPVQRKYERIFKDSVVFPPKKRVYQRRTN